MHKELSCLPIGESKLEDFVADYAEMLANGKGKQGVVVLPSAFLIEKVREQLMNSGSDGYENPNLMTFDDLVKLIVKQAGVQRTFLDRAAQEILVEELINGLGAQKELTYFSPVAKYKGFVSTVTSLIGELKRSGALPEEFETVISAFSETNLVRQKDREIAQIFQVYQQRLKELNAADLEEIYFLAANALTERSFPYQSIFIAEFTMLTPLQFELIQQMSKQANIQISISYEKNRPELYQAVEETYGGLVGIGFTPVHLSCQRKDHFGHLRSELFTLHSTKVAATNLTLLKFPHRQKECEVIIARIKELLLQGEIGPQEIAVVVRDLNCYDFLYQEFQRKGIPVSLPEVVPLAGEPLVELMLDFFAAVINRGEKQTVSNILGSPFVANKLKLDRNEFGKVLLTKVIENWNDWLTVLPDYQEQITALYDSVHTLPRQACLTVWAKEVKNFLNRWEIPEFVGRGYKEGNLSLGQMKRLLTTLQCCLDTLDGLVTSYKNAGLEAKVLSCSEFLQVFLDAVNGKTVKLESANYQGVNVVTPTMASGTQFSVVFILGLIDGEFPLKKNESWLYSDKEREIFSKDLGLSLKTAVQRRQEENLYFAAAVALTEKQLFLSAIEDAETLHSPYIDDIKEMYFADSYCCDEFPIHQVFPQSWLGVYDKNTLMNKVLFDKYNKFYAAMVMDKQVYEYTLSHFVAADFRRRVEAEFQRESGSFTLYNGRISHDVALAFCLPKGEIYSVSGLKTYMACPFQYLASKIVSFSEWEEETGETPNNVQGLIWHAVLAEFLTRHKGEILKSDHYVAYQQEIHQILADTCDKQEKNGQLYRGRFFQYTYQYWQAVLDMWLKYEITCQNAEGIAFRPEYLEWRFDLLTLTVDGSPVQIRGTVDRIDSVGDKLMVIDYKSGGSYPSSKNTEKGDDLQIPLYLMAVDQLLIGNKTVVGGGYYSIKNLDKNGGMWHEEYVSSLACRTNKRSGHYNEEGWNHILDIVQDKVKKIVLSVRQGDFSPNPKENACEYCVAKSICRYNKYAKFTAEGKDNG